MGLVRPKPIVAALLVLLALSLAGNALLLYRQASRPLYTEGDRPLIDRTIAHFAALEGMSEAEIRAHSFPIVMRQGERTCVELRYGRLGHRGACYDRSGRLIEETASVVG
jgi:hypothetical protein